MAKATPTDEAFDVLDFIISYETGELPDDDVIAGFQHLVDTGLAWKLQGAYGRAAVDLLDAGLIHRPEDVVPLAAVHEDGTVTPVQDWHNAEHTDTQPAARPVIDRSQF